MSSNLQVKGYTGQIQTQENISSLGRVNCVSFYLRFFTKVTLSTSTSKISTILKVEAQIFSSHLVTTSSGVIRTCDPPDSFIICGLYSPMNENFVIFGKAARKT